MAYAEEIAQYLNARILEKMTDVRFTSAKLHGIAESLQSGADKEKILPVIIDDKGEGQPVNIDTKNAVMIYHKQAGIGYTQLPDDKQTNAEKMREKASMDMQMVVYGNREMIRITKDPLEALIKSAITLIMPQVERLKYQFDACRIYSTSASFDRDALFTQEYKKVSPFLRPNDIYFSIKYKVDYIYRPGCVKICPH